MKRLSVLLSVPGFLLMVAVGCSGDDRSRFEYPETMKVDQVDAYHGVSVPDPYRWLEDDVRESEAVRQWVDAQNELTFAYLGAIPERAAIEARLTQLWDYERYGLPFREGGRYYYSYNDGLQNQDVIYTQAALSDEPDLLLDPNTWSEDGTIALGAYYPSPDGKHVAYLVQASGSDWHTGRVLDVASKEVLDDTLEWLKYSNLAWASDGSGFYYSRYPGTGDGAKYQSLNTHQAVYFHRLGSAQEDDVLTYTNTDHPDWNYLTSVTDDGRFLVITVWKGTDERHQIVYQDFKVEGSAPAMLVEGFEHGYTFIGNLGGELYFRTDESAPLGKLIAIDVEKPAPDNRREVIAEGRNVLTTASLVGGHVIGQYMQDAHSVVQIFDTHGEPLGAVELPGIGTASGFYGKADNPETFFRYESFNVADSINRLNVETGETEVFRKAQVDYEPDDYVVEQAFYDSKDGTRVPMFITHRKGLELDGDRPTMLYGYGGFNVSMTPGFSVTRLAWMEMGGVYAVANLRGGGEYGEEWHKAGTKLEKQNVFDDFIAAAEYLIDANYTNSDKLAIFGGSNGGLLVGAVTNQRPELFGAVIASAGVMDMLRFNQFTAGRFWVDDYGSSDDPEEFKALYAYSPYHNVEAGTEYPAILVTTADTDDRVIPGHSFKYAAALQDAQGGDAPILIRIETRAGHGAGTPTSKLIESYTDRWAFLAENLDMQLPEGYGIARTAD
ncbi:MAG: prolyl oligopeptidase family serine peptidase [Woeseiaceae bacterium]